MTFLNTVQSHDMPIYQDGASTQRPPRVWWHNGDKRHKTPGSFYTRRSELGALGEGFQPGSPWAHEERFEGEEGFSALQVKLAIIGWRSQPFIKRDDRMVWIKEWREGASFYTEILALAEGFFVDATPIPVVWCCKGLTGKAVTNRSGSILASYQDGLLKAAEQLAGKRLPLWSFWLPITSKLANGATAYEDTGHGSLITPPALHPSAQPTQPIMERLFIGDDLYVMGREIREEYSDWIKARRGNEASASSDDESLFDAAPASGGGTPERSGRRGAVEETDLPF